MTIDIVHAKVDNIAAWTQIDLDNAITAGQFPVGTLLSDIVLSTDWNAQHVLSGVGTAATLDFTTDGTLAGNSDTLIPTEKAVKTYVTANSGTGTVTSVAAAGSQGVTISGSPISVGGTISVGLGNITPTSVSATGTISGSNLSGTNTGDQTASTGLTLSAGAFSITNTAVSPTSYGSSTSIPSLTINQQGQVTAASGNSVIAPAGTLTGTTLASGVVTSSITSLGSSANLPGSPTTTTQAALTSNTTIATTAYCDNAVTSALNGLDWKQACTVATTANLVGTYLSGVFTMTATGVLTIDGQTATLNNTYLFKNQTTGTQNGAYTCTTAGSTGVASVFTRRSDYNTTAKIQSGDTFFIQQGTTNGGTAWSLTTAPPITLDTTSLTFSQVAGPGTYVAGTGLTLTGNSFSVNTSQSISTLSNLTSNGLVTTSSSSGTLGITPMATGVATFLSTPTSANLAAALTDGTGTGSSVFSASPILTTVKNNTSQTTLSGTTSGSVVWSQPEQGASHKIFNGYAASYENNSVTNQTITFTTAFTNTPTIVANNTGLALTVSTTTLTITAPNSVTTFTGNIIIMGY